MDYSGNNYFGHHKASGTMRSVQQPPQYNFNAEAASAD